MGPLEALLWHQICRRPARPCTGPHVDAPRGRVVVALGTISKAIKRSRISNLDVHPTRADPAPFGKTAWRAPSTRSPRW